MTRILQLIDTNADIEARRSASALATRLGEGFTVETRTIGRGGDYRNLLCAMPMAQRAPGEFDVVHAYGAKPLAAAVSTGTPIVFSPESEIRPRVVRWLRAAMTHRRIEIVAPTSTMRRILVERGVAIERSHLIRPGVDFGAVRGRRDVELRAALGFSENDRVLLAVGESTRAAAHQQAVWAASILHVIDRRYRMLMWGRGKMVRDIATLAQRLEHDHMLIDAEEKLGRTVEFERLLPVADAAIVSARGAVATLPIASCMAAGVPIVSTVTYTNSELLEDRHTALMSPKNSPRALAQRVIDVFEDSRSRWSIADVARTEAYEYFSVTRFVNQYRTMFNQLRTGSAIEVPGVSPGAGSRFMGRG